MDKYVAKRGNTIGKKMLDCLYIHKSAIDTLKEEEFNLYLQKLQYIDDFDFEIVKISLKKEEVSFIKSDDWDTQNEPSVGDSICVKKDNSIRKTKGSNLIYHHKWMFVKDSYTGFSVEESKKRSESWMNNETILKLKLDSNEKFNSKIGRRNYWNEKVCSIVGY